MTTALPNVLNALENVPVVPAVTNNTIRPTTLPIELPKRRKLPLPRPLNSIWSSNNRRLSAPIVIIILPFFLRTAMVLLAVVDAVDLPARVDVEDPDLPRFVPRPAVVELDLCHDHNVGKQIQVLNVLLGAVRFGGPVRGNVAAATPVPGPLSIIALCKVCELGLGGVVGVNWMIQGIHQLYGFDGIKGTETLTRGVDR